MKIKTGKKLNTRVVMGRLGYKPWRDPIRGREAYIKRMGASFYPRFHIFCDYNQENELIIDLHFDSRRPMHTKGIRSYEDEESEVVQNEAVRIKQILARM